MVRKTIFVFIQMNFNFTSKRTLKMVSLKTCWSTYLFKILRIHKMSKICKFMYLKKLPTHLCISFVLTSAISCVHSHYQKKIHHLFWISLWAFNDTVKTFKMIKISAISTGPILFVKIEGKSSSNRHCN